MADGLTTILAFAFVIGVMILVHEWGHFIAARAFGIRVDIFSFGMGPRIWGRKRGDTDYRLSAFPLGGYVKMAGDNPSEERSGAPDEFLSKPRWQRLIVIVAGPVMNIVTCAVVLFVLLSAVGLAHPAFLERPAQLAALPISGGNGLQVGDVITQVNGVPTPTWESCYAEAAKVPPGNALRLALQRGEEKVELEVPSAEPVSVSSVLGYPDVPAIVRQVTADFPAAKAGVLKGDQVVRLNGQSIHAWQQLVDMLRASNGEIQQFVVVRNGEEIRLPVKPVARNDGRGGTVWQVGIAPEMEQIKRRMGVVEASQRSAGMTVAMGREIFNVVGQLVTGRSSVRELQGVIGIARMSGQAVREGPEYFLSLMALISMNLAILNLLPIPILDGGHVLLLAIEGLLRRDLSISVKERFVQVGLVFLLFIFVIVMYNDLRRWLFPNF